MDDDDEWRMMSVDDDESGMMIRRECLDWTLPGKDNALLAGVARSIGALHEALVLFGG